MKIKCIYKSGPDETWFTVGKIYEVENEQVVDEEGYRWNNLDSIEKVNDKFGKWYKFELVSDTPTKEQLMNLKVGDKVRIGENKYPHWVSGMDKYRNQVVTINQIREDRQYFKIEGDRKRWYFLLYKEWEGELQSDIVEIISSESPTPTETIPEKKEEPTVEQVTPEAFKEAVINFISKLPYTGGTVSFAICEAERARIIEGIRELDIT